MTSPEFFSEPKNRGVCNSLWLWSLVAVVIAFFAVSRESLWIDEAGTANKVARCRPAGWRLEMILDRGSDVANAALHALCVAGRSDYRNDARGHCVSVNIPWFVAGLCSLSAHSRFLRPAAARGRRS